MITPLEYAFIFIVAIVVIIAGINYIDSRSKRERGIKKAKRKRIGRKHDH